MAIAHKARSMRRNIEDNDMSEDRLSDRSSDTDCDATVFFIVFFERKIYFINQQRKSMEIFTIKRHQE